MAVVKFRGPEEYELKLSRLAAGTKEAAGKAIYAGARIVADEVKKGIEKLPVIRNEKGSPEHLIDGVTMAQKEGLLEGFGITPMQEEDGAYNVKLGFDGYNATKTEKYPKGQPNQLIARSVESGTSIRKKHPFVRPAVNNSKKKAEEAMANTINREIEKQMK